MNLTAVLEGLLFIAGEDGVDIDEVSKVLSITQAEVKTLINDQASLYAADERGLMLKQVGGRYKLTTKPEHLDYYQQFVKLEVNNSLSSAALETLAIVAYKQPITRIEVDEIRGVSASGMMRKLVNLQLVKENGRSDTPGRPFLYKTTDYFLDYFNINSLDELPALNIMHKDVDTETDLYYTKYQED